MALLSTRTFLLLAHAARPARPARPVPGVLSLLVRCARPYQWPKNAFVLAPLLFGRKLLDPQAVASAFVTALGFCLLTSALYVFNDVLDVEADRAHPDKRFRPVASGALPVRIALLGGGLLLGSASALLWLAGPGVLLLASAYLALMVGYCLALKRVAILDVMVIAAGFVLRVVSGARAAGVDPSPWLIVCTFLLALYLAFAKRRSELLLLSRAAARHRRVLRQYTVRYLDQVTAVLACAAILAYALYTLAPDTVARHGSEHLIYGTAFVVYGLLRYMSLTQDPGQGGDPSRVLVRDRPLLLTALAWAAYNALVIYWPAGKG